MNGEGFLFIRHNDTIINSLKVYKTDERESPQEA